MAYETKKFTKKYQTFQFKNMKMLTIMKTDNKTINE